MRKLVKWIILPTAVFAGGGYLLFGEGLRSYATTLFGDVQSAVKGSVPIDFEIRRARNLIKAIDPEIREARKDVARAEVELAYLDTEIQNLKTHVNRGASKIHRQRGALGAVSDVRTVALEASTHTRMVERDLCRTFDVYKNQVELLASKAALRDRQDRILDAARQKLSAVRSERQKLEDAIESLSAKKRQLDAMAATARHYDLDTSSLSQARELIGNIRKRLDVTEKIIQEDLYLSTEAPVEGPEEEARDILREIDSFFGGASSKGTAARQTTNGLAVEARR